MKDIDLGEPTSFLDHVYLGCTQRESQRSKDIVDNNRSFFESRISAGATEKWSETRAMVKPDAETISSWSHDIRLVKLHHAHARRAQRAGRETYSYKR